MVVSKVKGIVLSSLERLRNATILRAETGLKLSSPPLCQLAREVATKKVVYIGEVHSKVKIVDLELAVLSALTDQVRQNSAFLDVFVEHFCLEQQKLIDLYIKGDISEEDLFDLYKETGEEGHQLEFYQPILEYMKEHKDVVRLKAGFVPRRYARLLMKEGEETAYEKVIELGYMAKKDMLEGTDQHYDFFESLISGRNLDSWIDPSDRYRKIFLAQILKDCVMASVIKRGIKASTNPKDKFLVIAGSGHVDHRFGVPERVDMGSEVAPEDTAIVTCRSRDLLTDQVEGTPFVVEKFKHQSPGQFVYFYDDEEEDVKAEIAEAYDAVGKTAHIQGDMDLAAKVMTRLGYTADQIKQAKDDAANYQV